MRFLALILLPVGCAGALPEGGPDGGPDAGHQPSAVLRACAAQPLPVASIVEVVGRLNALPSPVDAPCFVASLKRPLTLVATNSNLSAQPAASAKSPRIFVLHPALVFGVVPEGDGSHLLELGEWVSPTRTLKGEIALPVTAPLATNAPLTRVAQSNFTTSCGLCHRNEEADPAVDGGYTSVAFRPNPGTEVKLPALAAEHQACTDSDDASDRCALFHALFDFGAVRQGAFATDLEVFF